MILTVLTISLLSKIIICFFVIVFVLGVWYYFAIARPIDREVKKNHEKSNPTDSDIRTWDDMLKDKFDC